MTSLQRRGGVGAWLKLPRIADEDEAAKARALYPILLAMLVTALAATGALLAVGNHESGLGALGSTGLVVLELWLVRKGRTSAASTLVVVTMPLVAAYLQWVGNGMFDVAVLLYPILIFMASLLLYPRRLVAVTALAIGCMASVVAGHATGRLDARGLPAQDLIVDGVLAMLLVCVTALVGYLIARSMAGNLKRARESEELYRELVQHANTIILRWNDRGDVVFLNEFGREFFGFGDEDPAGRSLLGTVLPAGEEGEGALDQLMAVFDAPDQRGHDVLQSAKKDGGVAWVEWRHRAIRGPGDRVVEVLSVGLDITERRLAEAERQRLESQLRQSQKMEAVGTLAGGVAHDFNNILTVILNAAELARMRPDRTAALSGDLDQIVKASERAATLVSQILTFSRRGESKPTPCQIAPLLKETVKFLRASLPANIEIRSSIATTGNVVVDPTQLHQVVMNLGTNAYHAMQQAGGVLDVAVENVRLAEQEASRIGLGVGDYARLAVRDTGSGMDAETLSHIFEPYYTTKDQGKGTGLGLSVVHGIVTSAGGAVDVESERGVGSTFHVYLPVVEPESSAEAEEPGEAGGGNERLLLVDDEPAVVDVVRANLEDLGYGVTATTDPEEAVSWLREDPARFDLIITDLAMPKLDGAAVAETARRTRPELPVVVCTGFGESLPADKASAIGVRVVLHKPVPRLRLARALREALDSSKPP